MRERWNLSEHWKLTQQAMNCKCISIRKAEIFVGKLLHAKVIDQKLVKYRSQATTTDSTSMKTEASHQVDGSTTSQ